MTQKIVINSCFGGFGLSDKALHEVARRKGLELTPDDPKTNSPLYFDQEGYLFDEMDIPRNDPDLVSVVEELGDKTNGPCAKLEIVEIPDDVDWYIEEYDGNEHVAEKHRTWP